MSFNAELFRAIPPNPYGAWATDPFTGLEIPKSLAGNIEWRRSLNKASRNSPAARRAILSACAKSPIYWINAFAWTFLQKEVDEQSKRQLVVSGAAANVPFVTWRIQDEALVSLKDSIENGYDVLIHKSRDMGASWLVLALFHWFFQFRPSTTFLELSRKEHLVDKRGNMDSLMEKHRYLIARQPDWMRPTIRDNVLLLENPRINTQIVGESTNADAGQAARKTAILLDEFARVREGEQIDLSTADTSSCRIFNSTPQGPNTHFTRIFRAMKAGTRSGKLILLPWWHHPRKGADAKIVVVNGKEKVTNRWYELEAARRSSRNMAQNIDGEHGKSGDNFFDLDEIEKHRALFERDPVAYGNIITVADFNDEELDRVVRRRLVTSLLFHQEAEEPKWRLWVPLIDGRPNQNTHYVFGVDVAQGSGASNSVISVLDNHTNTIVAKFWDAFTSPDELAREAVLASIWFGGLHPAHLIFEKNGPGVSFGRRLLAYKYPNLYYQQTLDTKSRETTRKWGWHTSPARKAILLGDYRDALKTHSIINPCRQALDEAGEYTYNERGAIEPATLTAETGGGQALHGDHVIADALLVAGRTTTPTNSQPVLPSMPGSFWDRQRQRLRKRDSDRDAWLG